ncbi:hypothetical protein OXX79_008042, partial [Metschnikowia pulcherrima]
MTFAEPGPPTLIRTSRLSPEYIRKNLDTINVPIRLNTDESFERVEENWSAQELEHERRLVSLKVTRENFTTFNIKFETVAPDCVDKNSKDLVISCIRWAEKDFMVVTSVDILLVLESLVGEPFPVEEKSRIRRNLQFLKPSTVARSTSGRLFNSLMAMENPRPRNIEKDVKVFKWSNFFDALNKVLSKYSANPAVVSLEPRTAPSANPIEPASSGFPSNSNNSNTFAYPAQPGKAYVTMQPPAHYAPLPYEAESVFVKPHTPYAESWAPYQNQQQYFKSDPDLVSGSETSGNLTDLSLKSRQQTADTSTGESPDGTRA